MKQQITLTFLQYYYLLKSHLFKLLLLNPRAKQTIAKRCSEDIIFWLEFFVKLPQSNKLIEEHSRVPVRREDALLGNHETNQNPGITSKASERGNAPLSDSFCQAFFLKKRKKGLEKRTLSNKIKNLKASFKPQTTYNSYYWLKYKKDYILEIKERIENNKPLLVAKSANMDETVCTALVLLWFWLYKKDANFYTLGQTAKNLYYMKDNYSIFNLYKYVLNNLPHSLYKTEKDPPKDTKQNKLPFSLIVNRKKKYFVKLTNHANGNIIYGFSGSKRNYFPQHKRVKAAWLCNFAFHRKQEEHYNVLKNITECLIITSIPNGNGNLFHELSLSKHLDCYKLHWLLNPHYDERWYKEIISNNDLNHVHQFLDLGYEYKIKRQRVTKETQPVKKAAQKVKVVQTTTRKKRSTFSKTFTSSNQPRRKPHRNASFAYTAENYETVKTSLTNGAIKSINIPDINDNGILKNVKILRWHQMGRLINKNNRVQLSTVKTALKVIFHHQPDLTSSLLPQPQMQTVNSKIKKYYAEEEVKTIFPELQQEEKQNKRTKTKQTEQEITDHINKIAVRKYNPPSNRHCEKQSEVILLMSLLLVKSSLEECKAIQNQPPCPKNNSPVPVRQEEDFLKNQETNQTTLPKKDFRDPVSLREPFLKDQENPGIAGKASERGNAPLSGQGHHAPVNRAVGGYDNLIPDTSINKKTKDFFEKYKQNRTYKVRSTRFNITIKPPKFQRNKNMGIDGSAVEKGDAPLGSEGDHPPKPP